jgi:adenylate kinase
LNLVLFGPPGAGKGTQSQLLVEKYKMIHVSTGELLRAAIKDKTPLGVEAKKFVDAGNLVPDGLMIGLIKEVTAGTAKEQKKGILLDGFPRNTAQAEALDELLTKEGAPLKKAVFLEVPKDLLKSRLEGRRVCTKCGTTFHVELHPPKVKGVCDVCGGTLEHRADDRADVIENRLEVYEKNTAPMKAYYKKSDRFISVDGVGDPKDVFARLKEVF